MLLAVIWCGYCHRSGELRRRGTRRLGGWQGHAGDSLSREPYPCRMPDKEDEMKLFKRKKKKDKPTEKEEEKSLLRKKLIAVSIARSTDFTRLGKG